MSENVAFTVLIQSFRTYQSGQTKIRLLLEEQSDQGLQCLQLHLRLSDEFPKVWRLCLNFR